MLKKTSLSFLLNLLLFLDPSNTKLVSAFPGAAGHCDSGDLSAFPFAPHGTNGGGPLSNGSLQVKFDSTPLLTYTTAQLNANQPYTVTLDFTTSNSNFFFRGLLFRLSGKNGENVEGTFSVGSDGNVQPKSGCAAGISAITHNNRDNKISVSFDFEYTESTAAELLLEVTVVREKSGDNWFYNFFNIQIGDGASPVESPVEAPVESPVESPVEPSICNDPTFKFLVRHEGEKLWTDCSFADTETCVKKGVSRTCPVSCVTCDLCTDSPYKFKITHNGKTKNKKCKWVKKKATNRCKIAGVKDMCRATCSNC
jgi:hypothetical protein